MDLHLIRRILKSASRLDPDGLDLAARHLGALSWAQAQAQLDFRPCTAGPGFGGYLAAPLPGSQGCLVVLAVPEGRVRWAAPRSARHFWLGFIGPDGEDRHVLNVVAGQRR